MFDRSKLIFYPLGSRFNRVGIEEEKIESASAVPNLERTAAESTARAAAAIKEARAKGRPVILAFGAHAIKNGLGPLLAEFAEKGWFTHLATNGAGVIHDWEFAYLGQSSENVRENADRGMFGMWEETGAYINLAIVAGAYRGLGYGESVGTMIAENGIVIPEKNELEEVIKSVFSNIKSIPNRKNGDCFVAVAPRNDEKINCHCERSEAISDSNLKRAAAAADFLNVITHMGLNPGKIEVMHPFREYCLQYRTLKAGVPFTAHPMFGHDIIYTHPMSTGSAVGRTAERDFLRFAESVSLIEDGVYLSVGSAVMSPMIFEKSFSMAQNLALQAGSHIERHRIFVVDLSESSWDWRNGEPPEDNPAYYMRFLKSFSRMGGTMEYISADNRAFFLNLWRMLNE